MTRTEAKQLFNESMKGYLVQLGSTSTPGQQARERALPLDGIESPLILTHGYVGLHQLQYMMAAVRASVTDLLDAMGLFDDSGQADPA